MLGRLIDWAAFRLMYAMEEEERCWEVFKGPFRENWIATDLHRIHRITPELGSRPIPNLCVQRPDFKSRGQTEHYVKWVCIRVGIIHVLCFWRKDP
jgi:hypothetical protein